MTPNALHAKLRRYPRVSMANLPTPLEPLDRLSRQIGGPRIWLKRDDGIGPGLGGNKGRKLEFLLGLARQQEKRKVVTFGGGQSNHARMTAAACTQLDMVAHLFFFERRPPQFRGNLQLNQLLGARMHFVPIGSGGDASMRIETTIRLVRLLSTLVVGPGAFHIPVGGHNVLGCLGYVQAAVELHQQLLALSLDPGQTVLVTAVGTGGTLAGLLAGITLLRSPMRLVGIDVGKLWKAFPASLARLTGQICAELGQVRHFQAEDIPLIEETYAWPGYARFSPKAAAAIRRLARLEGIILDPIYSGKAFAGLLQMVEQQRFRLGELTVENIIFLHTGGLPGLWAQAHHLASPA